jgi:hypothetical protein
MIEGGLAQPPSFRTFCSRVLGAAAPRLEKKNLQRSFTNKAIHLCQDTDYEVRASMCDQLNSIIKAVG